MAALIGPVRAPASYPYTRMGIATVVQHRPIVCVLGCVAADHVACCDAGQQVGNILTAKGQSRGQPCGQPRGTTLSREVVGEGGEWGGFKPALIFWLFFGLCFGLCIVLHIGLCFVWSVYPVVCTCLQHVFAMCLVNVTIIFRHATGLWFALLR